MVPWLVAVLVLYVAASSGSFATEDACEAGLPAQREGSSLEVDDWVLFTHCELAQPDGGDFEAIEVHWHVAVIFLALGVGAWFAAAGLLGLVPARRALLWVLVSAVAFLLAS